MNTEVEQFATFVESISTYIGNILKKWKLLSISTIKDYLIVATFVQNKSMKFKILFQNNKLGVNSVIKDYLITAADGKPYNVKFASVVIA